MKIYRTIQQTYPTLTGLNLVLGEIRWEGGKEGMWLILTKSFVELSIYWIVDVVSEIVPGS